MSLQVNNLGSGLNGTSVSTFGSADGLVPICLAGGPPMQTITSNVNVVLSLKQSGAAIILSPLANITLTLPVQPCSQCNFKFIIGSNVNVCTITSPNANVFGPLYSNGAVIAVGATGNTNIAWQTTAKAGDYVEFLSDGGRWDVAGLAAGATAWVVS